MEKFKELKKVYWQIKLSDKERDQGWEKLKTKINPPVSPWLFKFRFALIGLILMFGLTAAGVSAAAPTSPLYPARVLADKLVAQVTHRPELKLEKRTQDIINAAKKPAELDQASKAYDKTLNEVKSEANEEKENNNLQKGLKRAEENLNQAIKDYPESKKKIEPILEKTRGVKNSFRKSDSKNSEPDSRSED